MWKKFVTDYLSFTRKDRVAVLVLVTLIVIVVLLPYYWPRKKIAQPSVKEIEQLKAKVAKLKQTDTGNQQPDETISHDYPRTTNDSRNKAESFYFDPNTLDATGWKRLGIRDRTAATIQKYLAKGGKFKKPEDIGKIYGLFKDDYERLLPYVQIKTQAEFEKKGDGDSKDYHTANKPAYPEKHFSPPKIVEVNAADTTAFIALPGIGSKLAARIINFRDKLGGFYSVQQVAETYGLPDSTFTKIRPLLQCNHPAVQQININTADANTLKQHPYIRWNLANAIVQYRNQHGNFKAVSDLQLIAIITPEIFEKMKPYLVIQ